MQLPQDPVFIVGYPRSGTTLLQRLLVTQPGFYSFPETHYFSIVEKHMQWDENGNIRSSCLDTLWETIAEKMEIRFHQEELDLFRRWREEKTMTSKRLFEYIAVRFLVTLHPGIQDAGYFRWIEKTPTHANFLERIIRFYPTARILRILRHPVPAIFSRKRKFPFNKNTPLDELARHWNYLQQNVERFNKKFPGYVHTLKYEDLVKNMEKELNAVADFLHVPLDVSLIAHIHDKGKNPEPFILPSETWKAADLDHPVADTNDKYKTIISENDAQSIETIVAKNMENYGYRPYFS